MAAFAARRLLALLGVLALLPAGSTTQNGRPGSWKVDTFVVLYMENRCARALSLSLLPRLRCHGLPVRCG